MFPCLRGILLDQLDIFTFPSNLYFFDNITSSFKYIHPMEWHVCIQRHVTWYSGFLWKNMYCYCFSRCMDSTHRFFHSKLLSAYSLFSSASTKIYFQRRHIIQYYIFVFLLLQVEKQDEFFKWFFVMSYQ